MRWGVALSIVLLAFGCGTDSGEGDLRIVSFATQPEVVSHGGSVLLTWEVTAADRVRLEACTGYDAGSEGDWCVGGTVREIGMDDPRASYGTVVVNLLQSSEFRLTAMQDSGRTVQSEVRWVDLQAEVPTGPRVIDFRAAPRLIYPGETAVLYIDVANTTRVLVCDATAQPRNPAGWGDPVVTLDPDADGHVQTTHDVRPTASRLYGLKLEDNTVLGWAYLTVRAGLPTVPNILSFTVEPAIVDEGDNVTISWATTDATGLTLSPTVAGFTGTESEGTLEFAPVFLGIGEVRQSDTLYTLTATNGEYADSAQVMISVRARPVVSSFTATPATIAPGTPVVLSWDTMRADAVTIAAVPVDASLPATFAVDGTATVTPAATTTYTLTATGTAAAPVTATATVTITDGAVIDSFTAAPTAIVAGGSPVILTWATTNATTVAITASPADASLPATFAVDGTATVTPAATTTYTLTATGTVGAPATATATATIVAPGDLVITEIMFDPAGVADTAGEWFEVRNISTQAVPVAGMILSDGTASHTATGTASLAAGEWFVFAINGDLATNGGVTVDYPYSTLSLPNTGALTTSVTIDGAVIDTVTYTVPGTHTEGYSLSLLPTATTATDNDNAANWSDARAADTYGSDGNHGTPGAVNACT